MYVLKARFMAPLARCHQTWFLTDYPTIYLQKWKFWIQLSPNVCIIIAGCIAWSSLDLQLVKVEWVLSSLSSPLTSSEQESGNALGTLYKILLFSNHTQFWYISICTMMPLHIHDDVSSWAWIINFGLNLTLVYWIAWSFTAQQCNK